jgi:hypothetical protein
MLRREALQWITGRGVEGPRSIEWTTRPSSGNVARCPSGTCRSRWGSTARCS